VRRTHQSQDNWGKKRGERDSNYRCGKGFGGLGGGSGKICKPQNSSIQRAREGGEEYRLKPGKRKK